MVLSKEDVGWLARTRRLIHPFSTEKMGPCGYDLSVGTSYYLFSEDDGDRFVPRSLPEVQPDATFSMPPNSCAFIVTEETVNMPLDLAGQLSLRFGLTKKGIMLSPQAPIDPGYSGKIMMMLYNLSDQPRDFHRGDSFVTITFHQLSAATEAYHGGNQSGETVQDFIQSDKPIMSSMARTEARVKEDSRALELRFTALNDALTTRTDAWQKEFDDARAALDREYQKSNDILIKRVGDQDKKIEALQKDKSTAITTTLAVIGVVLAAATIVAAIVTIVIALRPTASEQQLTPASSMPSISSPTPQSSVPGAPSPGSTR